MSLRPTERRRERGFTLVNVMAAILLFCFGMLALGMAYSRFTAAASQNQTLVQLAPLSNAFSGLVQANPAVVTGMAGTYSAANLGSAPAPLQGWLTVVLAPTSTPTVLPDGAVTIATGNDAASGSTCSAPSASDGGCSVTLTFSWSQSSTSASSGASRVTRSQTFYYHFPL